MKVFLTGFMGAGKSTHGKKAARLLGIPFIDLDTEIETSTGRKIEELFETSGEPRFREIESEVLGQNISNKGSFLLACGGGTPCFNSNLDLMKRSGLTIHLHLPVGMLVHRLAHAKTVRPLLQGKTNSELESWVKELLEKRNPTYFQARVILGKEYHHPENIFQIAKAWEAQDK